MKHFNVLFLGIFALSATAYGSDASFDEVTKNIEGTMRGSLSSARMESYGPIKFDGCRFDYTVSGTYPSGGLYTIKFSDIDFTSFRLNNSKIGHDYTYYIVLNFDTQFRYKSEIDDIKVRSTVINVADEEGARSLFKEFSRLGELCGAKK